MRPRHDSIIRRVHKLLGYAQCESPAEPALNASRSVLLHVHPWTMSFERSRLVINLGAVCKQHASALLRSMMLLLAWQNAMIASCVSHFTLLLMRLPPALRFPRTSDTRQTIFKLNAGLSQPVSHDGKLLVLQTRPRRSGIFLDCIRVTVRGVRATTEMDCGIGAAGPWCSEKRKVATGGLS